MDPPSPPSQFSLIPPSHLPPPQQNSDPNIQLPSFLLPFCFCSSDFIFFNQIQQKFDTNIQPDWDQNPNLIHYLSLTVPKKRRRGMSKWNLAITYTRFLLPLAPLLILSRDSCVAIIHHTYRCVNFQSSPSDSNLCLNKNQILKLFDNYIKLSTKNLVFVIFLLFWFYFWFFPYHSLHLFFNFVCRKIHGIWIWLII